MDIYEQVGSSIRKHREQGGLTQADVADALNVTTNTVSRWETTTYHIGIDDLWNMAQLFGVSIKALLPSENDVSEKWRVWDACANLEPDDLAAVIEYAAFRRWQRRGRVSDADAESGAR